MKLYRPYGMYLHGPKVIFANGQYHLFYDLIKHFRKRSTSVKGYGHAVSDDLITWRQLPTALKAGPPGAWDDKLADPGVCEKDGKFYLLYTGRSTRDSGKVHPRYCVDRLGLAVSDDLMTWKKHPSNPVLEADPEYYEADYRDSPDYGRVAWRDPGLYYDRKSGWMYAFICARVNWGPGTQRGCVGLARSRDMVKWECLPPVYHPKKGLCVEIPLVIKVGEKSVMTMRVGGGVPYIGGEAYEIAICSDDLLSWDPKAKVTYLVEQPWRYTGYRKVPNYCSFALVRKGKSYADFVHLSQERVRSGSFPKGLGSGRVSLPKKLLVEPDDTVKIKIREEFLPDASCRVDKEDIDLARGWTWMDDTLVSGDGILLVGKTGDIAVSVDVEQEATASAGMVIGLNREFTRGMWYTLEQGAKLLNVTDIERGEILKAGGWNPCNELKPQEGPNQLCLVLCDLHTEIYFNHRYIGSTIFRKFYSLNAPRYLGLTAKGEAHFSNLRIKELPWEHTYIKGRR